MPYMTKAWRVPFARFLKKHGTVEPDQARQYLYWVGRYLSSAPPHGAASPSASRFLNELGRAEGQEQVRLAETGIKLYAFFQGPRAAVPAPTSGSAVAPEWEALAREMTRLARLKHLSLRTERSYLGWLERFRAFTGEPSPAALAPRHVERFLSHLAVEKHVAASTQNQAFSALLFLYRHALDQDLGDMRGPVRAREKRRLPVVLSQAEVRDVMGKLPDPYALMARLIYGAGLRLQECLEVRVKDVDFERGLLTVRAGKGDKDRQTVLPQSLRDAWLLHLEAVRRRHELDRAQGLPGVALPAALERKYPNAGKEWTWFWAFPAATVSTDPRSGLVRRHHQHPSAFQKAFRAAVREARIAKPATIHTLRHASPRSRQRHPHNPGTPRPQGRPDDHDLHARGHPEPARRPIAPGRSIGALQPFAEARNTRSPTCLQQRVPVRSRQPRTQQNHGSRFCCV